MSKKNQAHHLTYKEIEDAQFQIAVLFLVAPLASDILIFVEWQTVIKTFTIYPVLIFLAVQLGVIIAGNIPYRKLGKMKWQARE